ncbi:MAG: phosphoribosylformylglycinamidine synthase, partial [Candidatus Omnitrophica bacterium]|nr:phosphoribosylformylglycinamidine synthase [Candidatus Omnitrophota bacterium]
VLFDERFAGNPLVFCGTVGVLPRSAVGKSVTPGALVVVAGGRTGRDGIRGATFSSAALTAESEAVSATAVQIGNPITEKTLADAVLEARDLHLFTAITDCGAGGLSSAVGELGEACGVRVDLEKAPLKYAGLSYADIWISEAQERMVLAVPPASLERLMAVCRKHQVEATVIGAFTDTKRLVLFFHGLQVADLDMSFLHHGVPRPPRPARWVAPALTEPSLAPPADLTPTLLALLARWDSCSREPIIRRYDHEVQGGSALKPLVGAQHDGPSDAAIVRPDLHAARGLIVANGINVRYGDLDPYWMAAAAIDEALRQIVAVGGSLDRVALLDNFCWGDTTRPEILGSLVRAAQACYDMATAFGTPFISGKDSLHNEYRVGEDRRSIPGTLLISALGVMPDVTKAVSMDVKAPGHLLYLVGVTKPELGGSAYYALQGAVGAQAPVVDPARALATFQALSRATAAGLVRACHDCSEGGLGLAAAEMAFAGGVGATIRLSAVPTEGAMDRDDMLLFSESTSRFLVEVTPGQQAAFEQALAGVPHAVIGETVAEPTLTMMGKGGTPVVQAPLDALKRTWQQPLEAYFSWRR